MEAPGQGLSTVCGNGVQWVSATAMIQHGVPRIPKRLKKVENPMAVTCKMLLMGENRFRCLSAPEPMKDVFEGAAHVNGMRQPDAPGRVAA